MTIPVNTVYEGDVFELLAQMDDQSVDMVFADPDYNIGIRYNGKTYTRRWIDPVYADLIRKRIALGRIPDEYRWRPRMVQFHNEHGTQSVEGTP